MEERQRRAYGDPLEQPYGDPAGQGGVNATNPDTGRGAPSFGTGDPLFGVGRTFGTDRSAAYPQQGREARPFETPQARQGSFEPSQQPQSDPFPPSQPENDLFRPAQPRSGSFPAPPQQSDPFQTPRSHTGPFSSPGAQGDPFSAPGTQSDPFSATGSQSGSFQNAPPRPFETPAPRAGSSENPWTQPGPSETTRAQTGSFEATRAQTQTGGFEATRAQAGSSEATRAQTQTGGFEATRAQTGSSEATRAQTGPFERQGNERAREAERSLPRAPMETRRSEPDPGRRSRGPLFLAGGVMAMIVAIAAVIVVMSRSDDPVSTASPSTTRPTVQAPLPGGVSDKYGFAASRKTDPQPLTLKELFGRKKVTAHGRSYQMTVRRADKKCKDAVHGTAMQKVLTAAGCTQLLRASFRDAPGKLIGTVGVANLRTAAAAKKAAKTGTGGELEDYITPLPGKDSVTKLLGSGGESFATAWPQGHYLILLWFQYKDGHKPSKTELKRLNRAATDITEASVFSALDTRALTGARSN
ncbi:hypothetical protein [Sphaerisporangium perillae]|uniref:hypothetical protein n=1 Tax=Sphaerisporangium perillae TaxID=2935860 RepID=UPI00200EA87D|nr:hypothetical protein [Sphaerisporangium perillae]